MALLEALSSTELLNFIIYDTISAPNSNTAPTPYTTNSSSSSHESNSVENGNFLLLGHCHSIMKPPPQIYCPPTPQVQEAEAEAATTNTSSCLGLGAMEVVEGGRSHSKKRRKRPRACKNKEEAETQRMTHITVERNRRKQMNEHLAVLRALMPHSYVQRGDQASIVGGAIEFVKELEHLLQSLEAQKLQLLQQQVQRGRDHEANVDGNDETTATAAAAVDAATNSLLQPPFAQFFMYPQYTWSQCQNKFTSKTKAAIADIEVTLIETHASLRILSRRCFRQLSKLVASFHALHLTILHLTVTTVEPLVLYSINAKVEEGCQLSSVDDIAAAVHHMLRIIEEEAAFSSS